MSKHNLHPNKAFTCQVGLILHAERIRMYNSQQGFRNWVGVSCLCGISSCGQSVESFTLSVSGNSLTLSNTCIHGFVISNMNLLLFYFLFLFFGNKKLSTCDFSTQCLYLWPPIRKVSNFFSFSCSCYPIFFPISFWLFILFVNVGFGLCKSKHIVPSCFFFFSSPDSNFIYYDLS